MKIHPLIIILLALAVLTFLLPLGAMIFHDSMAVKNTVYSASFSEGEFKQIKKGVSREAVLTALGNPLRRQYMLRYPNEAYAPHPVVPLDQLPKDAIIHREFWDYSAAKRFPGDYRVVEVALDPNGTVASTFDYVTD